jgi:hypothetical protein
MRTYFARIFIKKGLMCSFSTKFSQKNSHHYCEKPISQSRMVNHSHDWRSRYHENGNRGHE